MIPPKSLPLFVTFFIALSSSLTIHHQEDPPQGIIPYGVFGEFSIISTIIDSYTTDPKMDVREIWLCSQETRRGTYFYSKVVGMRLTFGNSDDDAPTQLGQLFGTNRSCSVDRYSVPPGQYIQTVNIEHSSSGIYGMQFITNRRESSNKIGGEGGSASFETSTFTLDDDEHKNWRWVGVQANYNKKTVNGLTFYIAQRA